MSKETAFSKTFTDVMLPASDLNTLQDEAQADMESRLDEGAHDGVVSSGSLTPSIVAATISLTAGTAYCFGKEYVGPKSIDFSAEGAEVTPYYGYIDDATEDFVISAVKPGAGDGLLLFSVMWDGATLTDLIDLRKKILKRRVIVSSKAAAYTVTGFDDVILVDTTTGSKVITLPSAVDFADSEFIITKIDSSANSVTITPAGAETINGSANKSLGTQWESVILFSNGSNWIAISGMDDLFIAGDQVAAATTTTRGTVELATDGEDAADKVVQGNDSRLPEIPTIQGQVIISMDGSAFTAQVPLVDLTAGWLVSPEGLLMVAMED